ncbi:MAG TPA: hypothetical protein VG246_08645 [Acidimicrobiales bacterium]|jgi:hypothetical protein|nr:hypothetical protein [Acidimicrobiales bacterium]
MKTSIDREPEHVPPHVNDVACTDAVSTTDGDTTAIAAAREALVRLLQRP